MTQEEKEVLLKDLCARLPYGVICKSKSYRNILFDSTHISLIESEEIKPYLRPMSSMTEKEKKEYDVFCLAPYLGIDEESASNFIDWLNRNMFDYRGLIEKGLALKAPENIYK